MDPNVVPVSVWAQLPLVAIVLTVVVFFVNRLNAREEKHEARLDAKEARFTQALQEQTESCAKGTEALQGQLSSCLRIVHDNTVALAGLDKSVSQMDHTLQGIQAALQHHPEATHDRPREPDPAAR